MARMRRIEITALLAGFFVLASIARGADPAADFVNGYLKKKQIPGCAVMVRQNGKVVLSAGYGMANLEHKVPATPETVFQSGSMGKQFTAMAIMMLVEEHKLALDDRISKHLTVPASWSRITVRHLLTHTAGLGDYPEDFSLQKNYSEPELLKMITAQPLKFAAGDEWNYSNLGYVTLGILIRKVTGEFYGDLLQKRIFGPLGMKHARIISEADIVPNRAAGYELKNGVLKNQEWVSPTLNTTADGSLYLTVEDIARWDEALAAEKLLSHAGYVQMWTPMRLNDGSDSGYGFGWEIGETNSGHRILEHGGAWQGFVSYIARYPDDQLTVVAFCNRAGADAGYIAKKVAGFYLPELEARARFPVQPDSANAASKPRRDDASNAGIATRAIP